jgi:hypothetical protein
MNYLLKIYNFFKNLDTKTLAFIGGALLMLFMMRQCNTISNLKEDLEFQKEVSTTNFNNYLAAKDSIQYFENELGNKVAKISSFEFLVSDLEKANLDINNKYVRVLGLNRDLKGVNSLLSAEIKVKDSLLALTSVTAIDELTGKIDFDDSDDFGSGNTRSVVGDLTVTYDTISKSFYSSPVNLSITQTLSLRAAITESDGRDVLKISSSYPGLSITGIENINLINDRLNKENKIDKKAGFSIGMGVGYGLNYIPSTSNVVFGPSINVGLYWSPKWLRF